MKSIQITTFSTLKDVLSIGLKFLLFRISSILYSTTQFKDYIHISYSIDEKFKVL